MKYAPWIGTAIVPDPPPTIKDGGLIREGYDAALDELKYISKNGKSWIANFQAEEITRTGINSLRLGTTRYLDIILEVTNVNKDNIPQAYIRKQTLKMQNVSLPRNSRNMKQKC